MRTKKPCFSQCAFCAPVIRKHGFSVNPYPNPKPGFGLRTKPETRIWKMTGFCLLYYVLQGTEGTKVRDTMGAKFKHDSLCRPPLAEGYWNQQAEEVVHIKKCPNLSSPLALGSSVTGPGQVWASQPSFKRRQAIGPTLRHPSCQGDPVLPAAPTSTTHLTTTPTLRSPTRWPITDTTPGKLNSVFLVRNTKAQFADFF